MSGIAATAHQQTTHAAPSEDRMEPDYVNFARTLRCHNSHSRVVARTRRRRDDPDRREQTSPGVGSSSLLQEEPAPGEGFGAFELRKKRRELSSGRASSIKVRVRRLLAPLARMVVGTPLEGPAYSVWNVVTRGSRPTGAVEYDQLTMSVMQRVLRHDSNGIDVGAHRGTILRSLVELAPDGRHYAVEPLPVFANGLRRRFPRVEVLELALSDQRGEATFHHIVTNPSYSGLSFRDYPNEGEVIEDIAVKVERLDSVIPEDLPIQFLKIDVEGGELGVLRGSQSLLRRWHPVVVFEHGWSDAKTQPADAASEAIWDELSASGLGVYELDAWLAGGDALSLADFLEHLGQGTYYFLAAPPPSV